MAQQRDDLAAAFKRFAPDRQRFLKEFAASTGQVVFRLSPDFEYEIKFGSQLGDSGIDKLLNRVVSSLKPSDGWAATEYRAHTLKKPRYHTRGEVEYSTFEQGGELIQKIKQHQTLDFGAIAVMKSYEAECTDPDEINQNLEGAKYIGKLRKERVKTYLLHLPTKTVYSLAVTQYSVGQKARIQCELEYAGHLFKRGEATPAVTESALLELLCSLGRSLLECNRGKLKAERETKLDFLLRSTEASDEISA